MENIQDYIITVGSEIVLGGKAGLSALVRAAGVWGWMLNAPYSFNDSISSLDVP